jgi:hypothetical protein
MRYWLAITDGMVYRARLHRPGSSWVMCWRRRHSRSSGKIVAMTDSNPETLAKLVIASAIPAKRLRQKREKLLLSTHNAGRTIIR